MTGGAQSLEKGGVFEELWREAEIEARSVPARGQRRGRPPQPARRATPPLLRARRGSPLWSFFPTRRRLTSCSRDWSSDVCSSDLLRSRFPRAVEGNGFGARPTRTIAA